VENARRQQKFMTNAGHELKTPISVIRANTELTEMLSGETEWTQSTMRQVDRLDELVGNLMAIVRDEERAGDDAELREVDASSVIAHAVESFQSVAQQRGVQLESSIAEGASVKGQESSIEQLACLLVDNAIKYCDENGTVHAKLTTARVGRGFTFAVSNDYAEGADVDYRRFFDRFYREDESHKNQQGYGIGLSVAQSICERYHGSIKASWKAGVITFTCVVKDA
jgi:signal transduction histidine kinase